MRYLLVQNGEVVNTILWDGESEMILEEGVTAFPEPEEPVRPADTDTTRWARFLRIVGGEPVIVWEEEAKTPEEIQEVADREAREAARVTIRTIITEVQDEANRAQTVIDSAAATREDKDNARAIKRMARAVIDLAQFVKDI